MDLRMPPRPELMALRREAELHAIIDTQTEEIRQLRRQLHIEADIAVTARCKTVFDLAPAEARVLIALLRAGRMSRGGLLSAAARPGRLDAPGEKVVDVYVHRLRQRLQPFGVRIETLWGVGFQMPKAARDVVEQLLAEPLA